MPMLFWTPANLHGVTTRRPTSSRRLRMLKNRTLMWVFGQEEGRKGKAKDCIMMRFIICTFHQIVLGRSPTEATRLRFVQEKKSVYSRLLVEPSVRNGASPTSSTTM
jgi:hypothetical protein